MPNDSLIHKAQEVFQLGMIELKSGNNEMEILGASQAGQKPPPGWTLPALAVAIAAARSRAQLEKQIEALSKRVAELEGAAPKLDFDQFDKAAEQLTAPATPGVDYEPDPEELEADYRDRFRKALALAELGAGWSSVVNFAFAGTAQSPPLALVKGLRPPTPPELEVIEAWLDRNAKRGSAL